MFHVNIIGARHLRNADWRFGDKSDPYCICEVSGKPRWTFTTAVIDNNLNPIWNYTFVLADHELNDDLIFTVLDKDWGTKDEMLGKAKLPGKLLHERGGFDGEIPLEDAGDGIQASLRLRVQAVPVQTAAGNSKFSLHSTWVKVPDTMMKHGFSAAPHFCASDSKLDTSGTKTRTYTDGLSMYPRCMFHPESQFRLTWEMVGLVILLADLIWIPMQVFEPPTTTLITVLSYTTMIYWTFDIFATLNSGLYLEDGEVVMRRRAVFIHYLKTWMFLDLSLVSIDWALAIDTVIDGSAHGDGTGVARSAKLARVTRVVRLLRLMRLAKLRRILFTIQSVIDSEWVTIVFAVVKNLMTMLAVNHLLACAWFLMGAGQDGWVKDFGIEDEEFGLQYVISLHWSLSQFTPGSSPIQPKRIEERYFAVMVLALGLVMATCFMSSITSTMAAVWTLNRYNATQHVLLKKFMKQNRVSRALGSRINRYVDFMLASRLQRVHASKVHFLTLLSGPLHIELQTELFMPKLNLHPCFRQIAAESKPIMRELCATAVETINFAKNDVVFVSGKEAKRVECVVEGSLVYRVRMRRGRNGKKIRLESGNWFVEAALWMPWKHVGEMKALTEVDIITVNCSKFRDIVSNHRQVYLVARAFAFSFLQEVERLWQSKPSELAVTDIPDKLFDRFKMTHSRAGSNFALLAELEHFEEVEADIMNFDDEDDPEQGPSLSVGQDDFVIETGGAGELQHASDASVAATATASVVKFVTTGEEGKV